MNSLRISSLEILGLADPRRLDTDHRIFIGVEYLKYSAALNPNFMPHVRTTGIGVYNSVPIYQLLENLGWKPIVRTDMSICKFIPVHQTLEFTS